jgi:hypothetical protein
MLLINSKCLVHAGIVNLLTRKAHYHEMMFGDFPDHLQELLLSTATLIWCSIVALHPDTMGLLHFFLFKVRGSVL